MSTDEKKQKYKNFGYCNEVLNFGISSFSCNIPQHFLLYQTEKISQ